MSNKNTKEKNKLLIESDFKKLIVVLVLILLLTIAISVPIMKKDKAKEEVKVFDVDVAWLDTNESFLKSGEDCEIFKVSEVIKRYDPKRLKLSVVGYGELYYHSMEIPRTTDVTFLEKEPKVKKFVKACYSEKGYIETVEKYSLEKESKKESKKDVK